MTMIAIKLGIMQEGDNVLDAEVLKKLQGAFKTQEGQSLQLFQTTQEYVQSSLDQAYYYASKMRDEVIRSPETNVNPDKAKIHCALKQMQIMN